MTSPKKITKYYPIKTAAKYCGVCLNTVYTAIYLKDLIPDKIVYGTAPKGVKPRIKHYLFSGKTLQEWKDRRNLFLPTAKAAKYLGLTHKQLLLRIYAGKIIPDKSERVCKGDRGCYYSFYFTKQTLDAFKQY